MDPGPSGGAPCATDLDCQLNGECSGGVCKCDAAWRGANCSRLALLPAKAANGYGRVGGNVSSWGAQVVYDPARSMYVMHVAEMAGHCGLGTWGTNSRCVIAEASDPNGPYTRVRTLIDPWCHGPALGRDPVSGRWIWTHMGNGSASRAGQPNGCLQCRDGNTGTAARTNPADPRSPVKYFPCPRNDGAVNTGVGLISPGAAGPWTPAGKLLESGGNSEPVFLDNGTLYFVSAGGVRCVDPKSGAPTGLCPAGCTTNSFIGMRRAETLDDALKGNYTGWFGVRGPAKLGGTNDSVLCVSWEDQTLYIDARGNFHMLAHAYRGDNTDYPLPGCRKSVNTSRGMVAPGPCSSAGGHGYSRDGMEWFVSPVAAYTAETEFEDGSVVNWRARERPHVVMQGHQPAFLLNGVGEPFVVNCSQSPAACQCKGSPYYPCPPQTGGSNTGGPGGDRTFTLIQPIARGRDNPNAWDP